MFYQILSPMVTSIEGDSLKEAIKNFTKVNYAYQFRNLLIADQLNNRYQANINYYKNNNKNKIGIAINRNIDNVGLNVYPNNYLKPILSESDDGRISEVGFGLPLSLSPLPSIFRKTSDNQNNISIKPIVTAPNMISASENGPILPIVPNPILPLSNPILPISNGTQVTGTILPMVNPNFSYIAKLNM